MLFLIFFEFSYLMNNCSAGGWSTKSHTPSVLRLRYKTVANLAIWQGAILEIVKLALPQVPYHWLADERRNAEKTMRRTREHIPSGISASITFRDGMQFALYMVRFQPTKPVELAHIKSFLHTHYGLG
jgi:hypothetical protein